MKCLAKEDNLPSIIKSSILLVSCFICLEGSSQEEILRHFKKGEFSAGFNSYIEFDYAQNYPYYTDTIKHLKKYPKPLIINVWYPAIHDVNNNKMTRQEYFEFNSAEPTITNWLVNYSSYTESIISKHMFGKERSQLDLIDRSFLDSFLVSKTNTEKSARSVPGKFPVVIYHQGAGSSIEDNSILCEWLASHGYIVIGCSFQSDDGEKLAGGRPEGSLKDVIFLLSFIKKLPNADWGRAAMIGHSLGAQAVNYIAAQGNIALDAYISLETTQEYFIGDQGVWPFVNYVTENAFRVKSKILFASNPYAVHDVADKMKNADRYYLTIPNIAHNDFISQGVLKKYLHFIKSGSYDKQQEMERAIVNYCTLCKFILKFLNAQLKGVDTEWSKLLRSQSLHLGYSAYVEEFPAGHDTIGYQESLNLTPSPRQIKFLLKNGQIERVIQLINKFWEKDSKEPIFHPTFIYTMIDFLLTTDSLAAKNLYAAYKSKLGRATVNSRFLSFGHMLTSLGEPESAKVFYDKLLFLDKENKNEVENATQK